MFKLLLFELVFIILLLLLLLLAGEVKVRSNLLVFKFSKLDSSFKKSSS